MSQAHFRVATTAQFGIDASSDDLGGACAAVACDTEIPKISKHIRAHANCDSTSKTRKDTVRSPQGNLPHQNICSICCTVLVTAPVVCVLRVCI
jgi:hypothetical protein